MLGRVVRGQTELIPIALVLMLFPALFVVQPSHPASQGTLSFSDSPSVQESNPSNASAQATSEAAEQPIQTYPQFEPAQIGSAQPESQQENQLEIQPESQITQQEATAAEETEPAQISESTEQENISEIANPAIEQQEQNESFETQQFTNQTVTSNQSSEPTQEISETINPTNQNETQNEQQNETTPALNETMPEEPKTPKLSVSLELPGKTDRRGSFLATAKITNSGSSSAKISLDWLLPAGFYVISQDGVCSEVAPGEDCTAKAEIGTTQSAALGLSTIKVGVRNG
jgi:hypothetical protein